MTEPFPLPPRSAATHPIDQPPAGKIVTAIPLSDARCKECCGKLGEHFHVINGVVYCDACATAGKPE